MAREVHLARPATHVDAISLRLQAISWLLQMTKKTIVNVGSPVSYLCVWDISCLTDLKFVSHYKQINCNHVANLCKNSWI